MSCKNRWEETTRNNCARGPLFCLMSEKACIYAPPLEFTDIFYYHKDIVILCCLWSTFNTIDIYQYWLVTN